MSNSVVKNGRAIFLLKAKAKEKRTYKKPREFALAFSPMKAAPDLAQQAVKLDTPVVPTKALIDMNKADEDHD